MSELRQVEITEWTEQEDGSYRSSPPLTYTATGKPVPVTLGCFVADYTNQGSVLQSVVLSLFLKENGGSFGGPWSSSTVEVPENSTMPLSLQYPDSDGTQDIASSTGDSVDYEFVAELKGVSQAPLGPACLFLQPGF